MGRWLMVISMVLCFSVPILAMPVVIRHDLSKAHLSVNNSGSTYELYQSEEGTSRYGVQVADGMETTLYLQNLNLRETANQLSPIRVLGQAVVNMFLQGDSVIDTRARYYVPGIHVSTGKLVIGGQGSLRVRSYDAAAIGSANDEEMAGTIQVGEQAQVRAISENAAGIGSGSGGAMSGKIIIGGTAQVAAFSDGSGAGIGAGPEGIVTQTGSILIKDQAQVTGRSDTYGAGIGSGDFAEMAGSITITDAAKVKAFSRLGGTGIGSGDEDADMSGTILINGNSIVEAQNNRGAAIGGGRVTGMSGDVILAGKAQVHAIGYGSSIGVRSNEYGGMTGSISILDQAKVQVDKIDDSDDNSDNAHIKGLIGGSSSFTTDDSAGTYQLSDAASINGISTAQVQDLLDAQLINLHNGRRPSTEFDGGSRSACVS